MYNLLILIVDTGILEFELVGKIFFAAFICIDGFLSGVLAKNLKVFARGPFVSKPDTGNPLRIEIS